MICSGSYADLVSVPAIAPWQTRSDTETVVPRAEELISRISDLLVEAARPKRIILFGSRARGDSSSDSDFDVMVVEERPLDRMREMVRLNRVLKTFDAAIDLPVVSEERFNTVGIRRGTFTTKPLEVSRAKSLTPHTIVVIIFD